MTNHVKCCYRSSKVRIGNWPQDLLTYLYFFFFFLAMGFSKVAVTGDSDKCSSAGEVG